jgi:hypothetical protein
VTRINNLNGSRALSGLKDQARQAGLSSPMNNAGIGEGGIEVYDKGTINVSDGNLIVNGTATISGILNADGTVTLSGTIKISGPLTISGATDITGNTAVTGDLNVNGPMKTTGTLSVEGVTTLKNNLNVTAGGKITAGNTTISPSASNGGIEFISGGGVGGNGGAVVLKGTGNAGLISNASMTSMFAGAGSVDVDSGGATVNGSLKVTGITSTASAPNVYYDPASKQLFYKP